MLLNLGHVWVMTPCIKTYSITYPHMSSIHKYVCVRGPSKMLYCRWYCNRELAIELVVWLRTLTYWGRDIVAAISQTPLSSPFHWMKIFEFGLKFHWSLFLRVQIETLQIGSDNGLAPSRRQAIIWTNVAIVHRHIYASSGSVCHT